MRSYQVALFTGQSDRTRCSLSPAQSQFLKQLALPPETLVLENFPYGRNTADYRRVSIMAASASNSLAYFGSRASAYRRRHRAHVDQLINRTQRTIFIAGSCGLELFNNLDLPASSIHRCYIFAFGPVARRRPQCTHLLVGGDKDVISRHFFPQPDRWVDCNHLNYLSSKSLLGLCRDFIANAIRQECVG